MGILLDTHEGDLNMSAYYTSVEEKLLAAAKAEDLSAIIDIVSHLSLREKHAIRPKVYDTVLQNITERASIDPAGSAYTTMIFIRSVGRYTSPEAVSAILTRPAARELQNQAVAS